MRFVPGWVLIAACGFETTIPSPQADGPQTATADAATDAPPAQLCTGRYGAADSFQLCSATPTSCRFYVQTDDTSCATLCASFGGTCIDSHDGNCATTDPPIHDCLRTLGDQVCNCAP